MILEKGIKATGFLIFIFLALALYLLVANPNYLSKISAEISQDISYSHAEKVHTLSDVELVRENCPKNGGIMRFKNKNGTILEFCFLPDGRPGFRFWEKILGQFRETSAFTKDGLNFKNSVTEVLKWCDRNGYYKFSDLIK